MFGYPFLKEKLKERWMEENYKIKPGEHEACVHCGSKRRHKASCPEHPKNKVKNP